MVELFKAFWREDEGQGLVEYALILVLIAIVVIAALTSMGEAVRTVFESIVAELS